MILTDYYRFEHLPTSKSTSRMDCVASTQGYNELEATRNKRGELFIYLGSIANRADAKRKTDRTITTGKGRHASAIFYPDITSPISYGDFQNTQDALLMVSSPDELVFEIFIARGKKNHRINLWQMVVGGELDDEFATLRAAAVAELATQNSE